MSAPSHVVVGEIAVGGPVGALAIHPAGTRVYALVGSDTVVAVDTATHAIVASAPLGSGLAGVTIPPDGTKVYVSSTRTLVRADSTP